MHLASHPSTGSLRNSSAAQMYTSPPPPSPVAAPVRRVIPRRVRVRDPFTVELKVEPQPSSGIEKQT